MSNYEKFRSLQEIAQKTPKSLSAEFDFELAKLRNALTLKELNQLFTEGYLSKYHYDIARQNKLVNG